MVCALLAVWLLLGAAGGYECHGPFLANRRGEQAAPIAATNQTGALPTWLRGRLVRSQTSTLQGIPASEDPRYAHLVGKDGRGEQPFTWVMFADGPSKVYAWDLDGKANAVAASSRFIRTEWYDHWSTSAMPKRRTLGGLVIDEAWRREVEESFKQDNQSMIMNTNSAVAVWSTTQGSKANTAFTNAPLLWQGFDVDTLASTGVRQVDDGHSDMFSGSHPMYILSGEDKGKTIHFVNRIVDFLVRELEVFLLDDNMKQSRMVKLAIPGRVMPPMMHSFWVTEHYAIFPDWSMAATETDLVKIFTDPHMGFMSFFQWERSRPAKLLVFDLQQWGFVATVPLGELMWGTHQINGYEQTDGEGNLQLVLDTTAYGVELGNILMSYTTKGLNSSDPSNPDLPVMGGNISRIVLTRRHSALQAGVAVDPHASNGWSAQTAIILNDRIELPAINQQYQGKAYRYFWGTRWSDQVVKIEVPAAGGLGPARIVESFTVPCGYGSMEPIFVPSPTGTSEDDGVLLEPNRNVLGAEPVIHILNASSMVSVATSKWGLHHDQALGAGFGIHGRFYPTP